MSLPIIENLKKEIEGFKKEIKAEKIGRVLEVGDGIARISGLSEVGANEMLEFDVDPVRSQTHTASADAFTHRTSNGASDSPRARALYPLCQIDPNSQSVAKNSRVGSFLREYRFSCIIFPLLRYFVPRLPLAVFQLLFVSTPHS